MNAMNKRYILAIDQSTSGTKALVLDEQGEVLCRTGREHRQKISAEGWVSHDPVEIYRNTLAAAAEALSKSGADPSRISCAALSNQRETALVWDRKTGLPVDDAVVWQCSRGKEICERIKDRASEIRMRTGLPLSPYFSASKIAWLLEHTGNLHNKNLSAGTIDSWLVYKLTGNFKTDWSNASRTQLLNLHTLAWDKEACGSFGIDPAILPEICDSDACFGQTDFEGLLPKPVPVHCAMGDSHASLFGQGCLEKGMGKVTYGTGSSVMVNIGEEPVFRENLSTSIAWGMNGRVSYALEGNINYSGAVIKWLVEDVKLLSSAAEAGPIAAAANPEDTTYLVPAFSGLGAPYWAADARASFWGMTRKTGRAELIKAAEECIAYQIADVIRTIREEGITLRELRIDGGGSGDRYLLQFQSDILDLPVSVSTAGELSGMGAAYAAGMALGIYDSSIFRRRSCRNYEPEMGGERRKALYGGWLEAVSAVTGIKTSGNPAGASGCAC
ncbi:MAG: glycerol kinase GlpK [Treponema sp.]|jgi:glycerol kinase|nr:glycerol kinase GlpK [Treponema sp.]